MSKKIIAYGMDGFITPMMKYFADEGVIPTFKRMLDAGAVNETFPSFPVWTPTNWATLSTGAHTGTHSVTRWRVEVGPGERINSFDGRANNAQRLWNALEREGLKGVALHYPAAHPSGVEKGYVIDGFGHPGHASTDYEIAAAQAYTTAKHVEEIVQMDHDGTAVRRRQRSIEPIPALSPADGWTNLPQSTAPPLASTIEIHARLGGDINRFHLLVFASANSGYDTLRVCRSQNGERSHRRNQHRMRGATGPSNPSASKAANNAPLCASNSSNSNPMAPISSSTDLRSHIAMASHIQMISPTKSSSDLVPIKNTPP